VGTGTAKTVKDYAAALGVRTSHKKKAEGFLNSLGLARLMSALGQKRLMHCSKIATYSITLSARVRALGDRYQIGFNLEARCRTLPDGATLTLMRGACSALLRTGCKLRFRRRNRISI